MKHKIVIVGGGFGGVKAALELAHDKRFHITIISDHPDFRVYPALYRISTGGAKRLATVPLAEIFAGMSVDILIDSVTGIDRSKRTVSTASGNALDYDGLILSLGVKTNYFGIKGLDQYAYGIKSLQDAEKLKHHLHQQLIDEHEPDMNYVIIGAGPTGVELAAALPGYIKKIARQHGIEHRAIHVDLVEAAPHILPRSPKDVSRKVARRLRRLGIKIYTKTAVQAQTADALLANGKPIRSHTVIWTAGVMNHPFFTEQGFQSARNHKVRVDQFLQADPGIYVIGDNADTPYSGLAQTALYDGKFVAKNLIRLADSKTPKPYRAVEPAYVYPVGARWAALTWRQFRAYGLTAWVMRAIADLIDYHDYEPLQLATRRWVAESVEEEDCPRCAALNNSLNF